MIRNLDLKTYLLIKLMKLIVVTILLVCLAFSQTPPIFPNEYELAFSEKASIGPISGNTTGKIYLDATNNKQFISRANGHYDRYCGSVYKLVNTPCNHYVVEGKRFLDFPEKRYCCFCCDSTHGCGIVAPDWIAKSNATYQGLEKLEDGKSYLKWEVKGLQSNFYYHANDTNKTPRRLVQGSDDLMDFTDYHIGIKDQSVFKLPNYCTDKCGLATICAGLRGQKNLLKTQ